MKTTLDIQDNLMEWIKTRAHLKHQSIQDAVNGLLEAGIEHQICNERRELLPLIEPIGGGYFPIDNLKSLIEDERE